MGRVTSPGMSFYRIRTRARGKSKLPTKVGIVALEIIQQVMDEKQVIGAGPITRKYPDSRVSQVHFFGPLISFCF
jgi:hypothetical protein